MKTMGDFLAHAIALERESAEQFDTLADSLEVHNNPEVTTLFRKMAHFSRLHLSEVKEEATKRQVEVPQFKPWEFNWPGAQAPETPKGEQTHYRMTAHQALSLALDSERRGQAFYQSVVDNAEDPEIRALAQSFADEEGEHVALLEGTIARYPPPPDDWAEDPDPPHQPE